MSDEKKEISKAPPSIRPVGTSSWTPPHRKKADFKKWARHDLWRIEEAIMLLLGLEPFNVKADHWDSPPEYNELDKMARGSEAIGALKFHSVQHVQPSVFVEWATSKGLDVPKELAALANKPDTDTVDKGENKQTLSSTNRGIPKQEVITAFGELHFRDYSRWNKALGAPPQWLKPCRVMKGSKKTSALWNPADIAVALIDKGVPLKKLDSVFIGLKKWINEWQEKSDYFR